MGLKPAKNGASARRSVRAIGGAVGVDVAAGGLSGAAGGLSGEKGTGCSVGAGLTDVWYCTGAWKGECVCCGVKGCATAERDDAFVGVLVLHPGNTPGGVARKAVGALGTGDALVSVSTLFAACVLRTTTSIVLPSTT